ncbi:NADPH-dependent FMN reductase [Chondromyces crocatus]|uniref:FMN reductase n=1 Tax=Chondromyces crocatus TaxID=52 RepID=A0A0K1EFA0_CHOCO|nr:NAD(P)H-dependent oxidoreductase [Chondromyces crocatus]AKT39248.1 FMN reductase [Chondromyces crocatus]
MNDDTSLTIGVILASLREGRMGAVFADWIADVLARREGITPEILDLRDWAFAPFGQDTVAGARDAPLPGPSLEERWRATIARLDAFIIVTPEFNHGYPGNLKNALDVVGTPWSHKPVSFVGYGYSAAGARAVEQLRLVAIELRMVPIRDELDMRLGGYAADARGVPVEPGILRQAEKLTDELSWFGRLLREGRQRRGAEATAR